MAAPPPVHPDHPRVVLVNISRGTISTHTAVGFIQAMTTGRAFTAVMAESGPYLDSGRNKVIANAYTINKPPDAPPSAPEWDWLLSVDSDIEFTWESVDALFAPISHPDYDPFDYPLMAGVYVNPFDDGLVPGEEPDPNGAPGSIGPVVYEWVERDDLYGEKAGIPTPTFRRLSRKHLASLPPVNEPWNPPGTESSPSPICEVACVGTGFLAMHHSILDRMARVYDQPLPWFEEPVRDGIHYGEDMGFCLRARDMGYPVLVNRACSVIHHKTLKLL